MGQAESSGCPETPRSTRAHHSKASGSLELLTHRQKLVLTRSWKKSNRVGLDNIGAQIFLKIYMRDPTIGNMFGLRNVPLNELKYHKFFQSHAMTFTRSLDFVVCNLDNLPRIRSFCRRLGKIHVDFVERGFRPEYWDIFAESLTECAIEWEGGVRCRDILVGWRKLISFVIEEMRIAFVKERRERILHPQASTVPSSDGSTASESPACGYGTYAEEPASHLTTEAPTSWVECPAYFHEPYSYGRRRATSLQPPHIR